MNPSRCSAGDLSGVAVGTLATLALSYFERLEWLMLGRLPLYAPSSLARYMARRSFGVELNRGAAGDLGSAARWVYGPSLGAAFHRVVPRAHRRSLPAGVALAVAIYGFELVAMPLVGATPPLRKWPRGEALLLLLHTSAFGLATILAERLLSSETGDQGVR
jgi:hypothetical protein